MGVKRGDLAILSAPGNYGKPRPALVLQGHNFQKLHSVVVALLTTDLQEGPVRFRLSPSQENGLRRESEVMLEKLVTMPRTKLGEPIGRLSRSEMSEIANRLALLLRM